jgi:hypothetical protein
VDLGYGCPARFRVAGNVIDPFGCYLHIPPVIDDEIEFYVGVQNELFEQFKTDSELIQ